MKRSWIETFSESLGLISKISDRPDWSEEFAMEGPRKLYKYPNPVTNTHLTLPTTPYV